MQMAVQPVRQRCEAHQLRGTVEQLSERQWDYIIVGTGMGGATVGHSLAQAGKSVLFVEKGRSHLRSYAALSDDYAESFFSRREAPGPQHHEALANAGRYTEAVEDVSGTKKRSFIPFIGSGTGGSSALYGMALERFFPQDFRPATVHGGNDATSPLAWPVNYDELLPFYQRAEYLFRVRGGVDPLRNSNKIEYLLPPQLMPPNQALHDFLLGKGLHPYQLPMACEQIPDCRGCQSFLCSKSCKNDSSRMCLQPAIDNYGAQLLDECEVLRIEASSTAVDKLICSHQGKEIKLSASRFIVAAGALETPRLLLNSSSTDWPAGLGNKTGLIGKNLMRHYIDLYAVFTGDKIEPGSRIKELAFNDLYDGENGKLGSVQSFGFLPPPAILVEEMERDIRHDLGAIAAAAFKLIKPLARFGLGTMLSRAVILASTMEDAPSENNRLTLSDEPDALGRSKIQLSYTISDGEHRRIETLRNKMKKVLSPYRYLLLKQADNNQRIAHICGTCRFGEDPQQSVCDGNNKMHGLDNLYIADSSVFPTSGGINPSLTIAALSLRLAQHLEGPSNDRI
ncbi:MAG: choline dehydrogenase-like flavoprotein [Halioglobus sp.]|jgi:choline dehydrogenase-like flavoprotein